MLIPVYDRFANAFPRHVEGEPATYGEFVEAMSTCFAWDAHFSPYSVPAIARRLDGHRGEIFKHTAVPMVLFVVDCDAPKGTDREAWDDEQSPRAQLAIADGAFCYETLGGFRLVWALAEPVVLTSLHDAERWKASYLAALDEVKRRYGIDGDRACCDWTRQFRLPFVVRQRKDGTGLHTHTPENTRTTDPKEMGVWSWHVVDVPEPKALTAVSTSAADAEFPPASPELLEHVRERLRRHGPAIEGKGGDQHTFVACAMVARGYALSDSEAVALLTEWNRTCVPPWDGDELRTKMDNAFTYGQDDVGEARRDWEGNQTVLRAYNVTPDYAPKPLKSALFANILPPPEWDEVLGGNLKQAATAAQAVNTNPYAAILEASAVEVANYLGLAGASPDAQTERPFFMSAGDLYSMSTKPPAWLVHSLILVGGTAMISAEPKAAKTWVGTDLAVSLATGTDALGKYKVNRMNVAYFYTEDMHDAIKSRTSSLLAGRGLTVDSIRSTFHAQPRGRRIDVSKPDDCARIIASVRMIERTAGKVGVLFLDPLRNIHMRDEDKSGEMTIVFEALKMIGTLLGCTVVVVHHAKKNTQNASKRGGQRMRGSSAIHGFYDSALHLSDTKVSDDNGTFTNTVECETKTGRSAGVFELTLKIEDENVNRTAIKATWHTGTKGETTATEDNVESWREVAADITDAFYENKVATSRTAMTSRALKTKIKGRDDTRQMAIKTAVLQGWLRQDRKTQTYHITPAGEVFSRERHGAGIAPPVMVPPSESPHPAAAFVS